MQTLERNSIVACGSSWRLILALASLLASCLKLARPLAAETRDARADRRLRVFAERWEARRLEVEHQNELGREGNVR